ncbi:hypothetical protein JAAARDRAFT_52890 [Jaapia argillacea MUCL 33604]|uniref:EF-hand domain-containing protein n=1 Tax=Jaapia argillacea MUCL 33604 TaxID=933084 RepID=A0A067QN55_9AGAM|nr:hypothetical protein JAAARDRAFT_52890 [Jaapia argillacea MUCL 33604]
MQPPRKDPSPPLRYRASSLFNTENDYQEALPSPPYQRQASTSQVVLDGLPPPQSPAYRSQTSFMDSKDERTAEVDGQSTDIKLKSREESSPPQKKLVVHYPDDIDVPSYHNTPQRLDSGDALSQRVPLGADTDDEDDHDDEDDYDWSAEEDLVDEEAKFEQKMGGEQKKRKGWGLRRIITLLLSSLLGTLFLSSILVAVALLLHFYFYIPHPTSSRRYLTSNISAWLYFFAVNLLISWFLALLVDLVPVFVRFGIAVAWGHVSEDWKTRLEMYGSVKGCVKPVLYAASGWVSWVIIFQSVFGLYDSGNEGRSWASYTPRVHQAIEFLFFLALVLSVQRLLSQAIAFAFHRVAYADRLESLREALKAVEKLRTYKPKHRSGMGMGHRSGKSTPVLSVFGWGTATHDVEDGDVEDEMDVVQGRGKKKGKARGRSSWLHKADKELLKHKRRKDESRSRSRSRAGSRSPIRLTSASHSEPSTCPISPVATPTHAHTYPPTAVAVTSSPERTVLGPAAPTHHRRTSSFGFGFGSHRTGKEHGPEDEVGMMQAAKVLKTAVLHDARNIKGKEGGGLNGLMWNVGSAHEAKRLAKAIYTTFKDKKRHSPLLLPADFEPAFPSPEEAAEAFRVFDVDNNGDISRAEIKTTLLKIYKERRSLSRSMRDVSVALKTLDQMLLVAAFVVLFFVSLSIFRVNYVKSLTSLYSLFIAASFIFKSSASGAFDAVMFIFVTHPFDTGDRCFIDDENLVVKKMGLFATVFARADGTETYYFNSQLFNKFITNARRSGKTFENLTMQVAWKTPLGKLDELSRLLNDWLQKDPNRWYEPSTSIGLSKIEHQRYLELTIGIGHNGYIQDWGMRMQRKTTFHAAVQHFCRHLGIVSSQSPMPIIWAGGETMPGTPTPEVEDYSPSSPVPESALDRGADKSARDLKPCLGFVPAAQDTTVRKSRSKKLVLRSMGAEGGDG